MPTIVICAFFALVFLARLVANARRQIELTFFLPPLDEPAVYSEKYCRVKGGRLHFWTRCHIVLTSDNLVISVCRMFYRIGPSDISVYNIPKSDVVSAEAARDDSYNVLIRTQGKRGNSEWRIWSRDPRSFLHAMSVGGTRQE